MTFRFYLREQRDRPDAVGDLARMVLHSKGVPPANDLEAYRASLQERGATDAILAALERTWNEYKGLVGGIRP